MELSTRVAEMRTPEGSALLAHWSDWQSKIGHNHDFCDFLCLSEAPSEKESRLKQHETKSHIKAPLSKPATLTKADIKWTAPQKTKQRRSSLL